MDIFDRFLGVETLESIHGCKGLQELVLFPITESDYFISAIQNLTFKSLLSAHLGLFQINETQLTKLLAELAESCPSLITLKLDIYQLEISAQDSRVIQV